MRFTPGQGAPVHAGVPGSRARRLLARLDQIIGSSDGTDLVERLLDADVHTYLPDDLLVKVDIATMAHALEGRSPFLDHELMEFAATLPVRFKVQRGEKKVLLRRLAASRRTPLTMPRRASAFPSITGFATTARFCAQALSTADWRGVATSTACRQQMLQRHASAARPGTCSSGTF
jgi:asparagine synthase (glutamine-hydrolysing)